MVPLTKILNLHRKKNESMFDMREVKYSRSASLSFKKKVYYLYGSLHNVRQASLYIYIDAKT